MSEISIPQRRSKRKVKWIIPLLSLFVIGFFGTKIAREVIVNIKLKQELRVVNHELEQLQTKQEELVLEKTKLEDPTYVQTYARGTHLLSKSEEQVFILPKP